MSHRKVILFHEGDSLCFNLCALDAHHFERLCDMIVRPEFEEHKVEYYKQQDQQDEAADQKPTQRSPHLVVFELKLLVVFCLA